MTRTEAVLFDWRGTLAVGLTERRWVELALRRAGRSHTADEIGGVVASLEAAAAGEQFQVATPRVDCSPQLHRDTYRRLFAAAGVDAALGDALYAVESDPAYNPLALDVPRTLRTLAGCGLRVGLVCDVHFDIRPAFADDGLADLVDVYALSYELGVQKPDPAIFEHALKSLGVQPRAALMVGDRADRDGAAATLGIPTLLLPSLHDITEQRLDVVVRAAGCTAS